MKKKTVYALGFFDGVHTGHQQLLKACRALAKACGGRAGAVTFETHPEALVAGKAPDLINTCPDRKRLLLALGMETVEVLPFDEEMRNLPWQDFLEGLVNNLGAAGLVCGADFRFGKDGEGNGEKLLAFCESRGLLCAVMAQHTYQGQVVSSTAVRRLLEAGEIARANAFLGHPHIFTGTVVKGKQLGRTIGVPTANLHLEASLVQPKTGVYACRAYFDGGVYPAVTNIGTCPTVGGRGITVEAWILDYAGDLYGKELTLAFEEYLRPERKFSSLQDLQQEIGKNALQTRKLLEKR